MAIIYPFIINPIKYRHGLDYSATLAAVRIQWPGSKSVTLFSLLAVVRWTYTLLIFLVTRMQFNVSAPICLVSFSADPFEWISIGSSKASNSWLNGKEHFYILLVLRENKKITDKLKFFYDHIPYICYGCA